MSVTLTAQEQIRDLEVQISRHKDELRLKDKEKNDALIIAENATKRADESDQKAVDALKRADQAFNEARLQAGLVEAANTAAAASEANAAKAVASYTDAKGNLDAAVEENKQLKVKVSGLEKVVTRLEAQLAEAQPKLDALAVLNLNI